MNTQINDHDGLWFPFIFQNDGTLFGFDIYSNFLNLLHIIIQTDLTVRLKKKIKFLLMHYSYATSNRSTGLLETSTRNIYLSRTMLLWFWIVLQKPGGVRMESMKGSHIFTINSKNILFKINNLFLKNKSLVYCYNCFMFLVDWVSPKYPLVGAFWGRSNLMILNVY